MSFSKGSITNEKRNLLKIIALTIFVLLIITGITLVLDNLSLSVIIIISIVALIFEIKSPTPTLLTVVCQGGILLTAVSSAAGQMMSIIKSWTPLTDITTYGLIILLCSIGLISEVISEEQEIAHGKRHTSITPMSILTQLIIIAVASVILFGHSFYW